MRSCGRGRAERFWTNSLLLFFCPEVFGFADDVEVEVGGFAGAEVFGFELLGGNFVGADDDAVFGDFAGVGEFVA